MDTKHLCICECGTHLLCPTTERRLHTLESTIEEFSNALLSYKNHLEKISELVNSQYERLQIPEN